MRNVLPKKTTLEQRLAVYKLTIDTWLSGEPTYVCNVAGRYFSLDINLTNAQLNKLFPEVAKRKDAELVKMHRAPDELSREVYWLDDKERIKAVERAIVEVENKIKRRKPKTPKQC